MCYDGFRTQGLPFTRACIESTIKQVDNRVKGGETFWSHPGGAVPLQLAGDYLSDRPPLDRYGTARPQQATRLRCDR